MIRLATRKDADEIFRAFCRRKDIFPHIRKDYINRRIEDNECIYQDGVVITFQWYLKSVRLGDTLIPRGSCMLHQILNSNQFSGHAKRVWEFFVDEIVCGETLYLSVREDNRTAREFYERRGMLVCGRVNWKDGKMPGVIYRLDPPLLTG